MEYPSLTFEKPDVETFRNLSLAYKAMSKGGNMACVLNAANEVVVDAFLKDKIGFLEMSDVIENCMEKSTFVAAPTYDDFVSTNEQSRMLANELIK
jgi:1-deoxy-D-xylulose-5-phosphate reductoisomerase